MKEPWIFDFSYNNYESFIDAMHNYASPRIIKAVLKRMDDYDSRDLSVEVRPGGWDLRNTQRILESFVSFYQSIIYYYYDKLDEIYEELTKLLDKEN